MNLYNLKIFADTARLGSMTKAAELNRLSRPAVSQAIKKLELELDVELLIHQRRFVDLTAAGRLLLKKSADLLAETERIVLMLRQGKGPLTGNFKIGSSRTLATFNLSTILQRIVGEYPEIAIQVIMANSGALIEKLENREIDLAFMLGDDALEGSKQTVVARGHFVLVSPKSRKEENLKYALTERRPETERVKVIYERMHHRPLPVFAEIHSWDAIWHAVNSGICGGLVPDFLFTTKSGKGRTNYSVVIPKVFPYEIKAVHLASKVNDPLVISFLKNAKIG